MISRVAVLGSGQLAQGITQLLCVHGVRVIAIAPTNAIDQMHKQLRQSIATDYARRILLPDDLKHESAFVDKCASRVTYHDQLIDCRQADIVIEAAGEDLKQKQRIVRELRLAAPDTVITSHSEQLLFKEIFADCANDAHVIGTHFVHPIADNKLIEVVPMPWTNEHALAVVQTLAELIGKKTLYCQDEHGLIANRLIARFCDEKKKRTKSVCDSTSDRGDAHGFDAIFQMAFNSTASLEQLEMCIGKDTVRMLNAHQ